MLYVDVNNNLNETNWHLIEKQLISVADTADVVLKHRYHEKSIRYWNIPAAFDTESTSHKLGDTKYAWMYEWTFGIGDYIYIGRTWEEYIKLTQLIKQHLGEAMLFVGVHNLSFDFQFMREYFQWSEVFSNDERHPIRAVSDNIEYRCTATISALPLANLADNLVSHKIKKLKGELDYSVIRTYKTPLSHEELQYCINDVRIILYYIQEQIQQCGNITKIPLTNTGRVRQYVKEHCLYVTKKDGKKGRNRRYINEIAVQTLTPELYTNCKLAFRGGFTHANPLHNGKELNDVTSYDLTSAYPSVMITEKYPFGAPEHIDVKEHTSQELRWYLDHRCCLFKATFHNLCVKDEAADTYISWIPSKMSAEGLKQLNNGRVTAADTLTMYMTEIDFQIIERTYNWGKLFIDDMTIWFKRYLNTDFVKCILKFYNDKTKLKGVKDKVIEYLASKGMLNSLYGMLVMDICRDENDYSNTTGWECKEPDLNDKIEKYNTSSQRFTYYPTGLWVTAYCRRLVWKCIVDLGDDYVYSDTDSVKILGNHDDYFKTINDKIRTKVYKAMDYHKLPRELAEPLTIKQVSKLLGVWDNEGTYKRFKTLGAKRYLTETIKWTETKTHSRFKPVMVMSDVYEITVSGVTKDAVKYLKKFEDPFYQFTYSLDIPASYTGKLTHTYIDYPVELDIKDCNGVQAHVSQLTSVHLEPAAYSMKEDYIFEQWLDNYREMRSYDL